VRRGTKRGGVGETGKRIQQKGRSKGERKAGRKERTFEHMKNLKG